MSATAFQRQRREQTDASPTEVEEKVEAKAPDAKARRKRK